MTIFQSAWLKLDISPCSNQSNLIIALILFCLVATFYSPKLFLFSISHIFDNIIKSVRIKVSQLDTASEAIHQRILLYNNLAVQ